MEVTETLLKQVAKMCRLNFTEEQYRSLKDEFDRSLADVEVIFTIPTSFVAEEKIQPPETDDIEYSKLRA